MIRRLLIAAALAGLCACSPAAEKAAPPAAPPAAAQAQGGDWYVTIAPEGHTLDFRATPEDQASIISLTCTPGTGAVSVTNAEPVTLAAGGATQTFAPQAAAARLDDPLFQALRASGVLQVASKGVTRTLTGSAEGKFAVKAFFQFCTNPSN